MTNEPRQKIMETLGATGCYFLSIVNLAETITKSRQDSVAVFLSCLNKYVQEDCFVTYPAIVLSKCTNKTWEMKKTDANYVCQPGELEILRFERKTVGATIAHFVVGDGKGNVIYDPYGDSNTVKFGKLISKRIFYTR